MATGYTDDVRNGKVTEFKDYALSCARAFGALVMMRDDPADAPIPDEFKPDDHHKEALAKSLAELSALHALTQDQREEKAKEYMIEKMRQYEENEKRVSSERERYESMLKKVRSWEPPTAEHQELRKFMDDQLTKSIAFDCCGWNKIPEKVSSRKWFEDQEKSLLWSVSYHTVEYEKEVARARDRSAWVKALKDSLK